jgi:hypothetical protein
MSYTNGLDDPTIFFNILTYTGDDSAKAFTGVGFAPDFNWTKVRSNGGSDQFTHQLADSVRGTGKTLWSSENDAESSNYSNGYINAFGSDGYTVTAGDSYNGVGRTYVSWNWKAGGSASSNTDGSITSSVSANTTAGFSIVSWTGSGSAATIGHSIGVQPQIVFVKNRDDVSSWNVYTVIGGGGKGLFLNDSAAFDSDTSYFNNGTASTTTFPVGTANTSNGSSDNMIAYCFANVKGYSKIGSYTGNGNADGTFIYTGFKPAFVLQKCSSHTGSWHIHDNKRSINGTDKYLYADTNEAEVSTTRMDFLSNGFKLRSNHDVWNGSGRTNLYMAFAESPFVNSSGVPNNAR